MTIEFRPPRPGEEEQLRALFTEAFHDAWFTELFFQRGYSPDRCFLAEHPDAVIRPLTAQTLPDAQALADRWYRRRTEEEDAGMERVALDRAFAHWQELGMEGLVLYVGDQVVAMTMGSFLDEETIDVHFEKADTDYPGAYAVINRAFARHIREKYPAVRFLNREDDMGLEGLRKAKLSYQPHHMVEKCWAHLVTEEFHDY